MKSKVNLTFKTADCPGCNNEAVLKEDDELGKTIICLHCGFYRSGSVSFYMQLSDVNQLRKIHGFPPVDKLIDNRHHS